MIHGDTRGNLVTWLGAQTPHDQWLAAYCVGGARAAQPISIVERCPVETSGFCASARSESYLGITERRFGLSQSGAAEFFRRVKVVGELSMRWRLCSRASALFESVGSRDFAAFGPVRAVSRCASYGLILPTATTKNAFRKTCTVVSDVAERADSTFQQSLASCDRARGVRRVANGSSVASTTGGTSRFP